MVGGGGGYYTVPPLPQPDKTCIFHIFPSKCYVLPLAQGLVTGPEILFSTITTLILDMDSVTVNLESQYSVVIVRALNS